MSSAIFLASFLGFGAGAWFADWSWRWKIHAKARERLRLEADGKLYEVIPARPWIETVNPPEDVQ